MQNIVRYTKILMNIGTKILLVLLWLFYIYGIYNILFHNWHSEFVGHPKGMHLPHNIYWLVWGINFIILNITIWKIWPQLSKLHNMVLHVLLFLIPFFLFQAGAIFFNLTFHFYLK